MTLNATPKWKEELIVTDEEGNEHSFDCGWGVSPPVPYIPSASAWPTAVPHWLRCRRDEVIEAMQRASHVVADDE